MITIFLSVGFFLGAMWGYESHWPWWILALMIVAGLVFFLAEGDDEP